MSPCGVQELRSEALQLEEQRAVLVGLGMAFNADYQPFQFKILILVKKAIQVHLV